MEHLLGVWEIFATKQRFSMRQSDLCYLDVSDGGRYWASVKTRHSHRMMTRWRVLWQRGTDRTEIGEAAGSEHGAGWGPPCKTLKRKDRGWEDSRARMFSVASVMTGGGVGGRAERWLGPDLAGLIGHWEFCFDQKMERAVAGSGQERRHLIYPVRGLLQQLGGKRGKVTSGEAGTLIPAVRHFAKTND